MKHTEKKYSIARVQKISRRKLTEIREKHSIHGVSLSCNEKRDLLLAGKAKMMTKTKLAEAFINYTSYGAPLWCSLYDWTQWEKKATSNDKKIREGQQKVEQEETRVCDEIMLGDEQEALKAIRAFDAMKV